MLAPLLVLYGLQQGVIGTLLERMNRDPAMRAIIPDVAGSNRFDAEWFELDAAPPGRRLRHAEHARHRRAGRPAAEGRDGDGAGPRLLAADGGRRSGRRARAPPLAEGLDRISVSRRVAEKLGIKPGDQVVASIERTRGGRVEPVALTLSVLDDRRRRTGTTASPPSSPCRCRRRCRTTATASRCRRSAGRGDGEAPPTQAYPLFRLYAKTIARRRADRRRPAPGGRLDLDARRRDRRHAGAQPQSDGHSRHRRHAGRDRLSGLARRQPVGERPAQAPRAGGAGPRRLRARMAGLLSASPRAAPSRSPDRRWRSSCSRLVAATINLYFSQSIATGESACRAGRRRSSRPACSRPWPSRSFRLRSPACSTDGSRSARNCGMFRGPCWRSPCSWLAGVPPSRAQPVRTRRGRSGCRIRSRRRATWCCRCRAAARWRSAASTSPRRARSTIAR